MHSSLNISLQNFLNPICGLENWVQKFLYHNLGRRFGFKSFLSPIFAKYTIPKIFEVLSLTISSV